MNPTDIQPFRLIKSRVPIKGSDLKNNYSVEYFQNSNPNDMHCATYTDNGQTHSHFCQWIHEPITITPNLSGGYKYVVMYPAPYSDGNTTDRYIGGSDPFDSELGPDQVVRYGDFRILFIMHIDKENKPVTIAQQGELPYYAFDIYQQVKASDPSQPVVPMPDSVLKCKDGATVNAPFELEPVVEKSPDKKQEQLGWFVPKQQAFGVSWYEPACKPAINLYPKTETMVNVHVAMPKGFLTYTDPLYPPQGWTVLAKPSGQLQYLGNSFADSTGKVTYATGIFPYLYYEGKIADTAIAKPEKGFVRKYEELKVLYDELLPKLGLNAKETKEFTEYWVKALPKAPYYFVGMLSQAHIEQNEPLTILPKEDTMIRVRLYFEALDTPKAVEAPVLHTPTRNGFTVVDWGGMVKQDKTHPFTCIQ